MCWCNYLRVDAICTLYIHLTLSPLAVNFEDRWWPMQTIWIQMKPQILWGFIWGPTKCGASSEIQIVWHSDYISEKYMWGNNDLLHHLKEKNIWKNYPACKELKRWKSNNKKSHMGIKQMVVKRNTICITESS